MYLYTIDYLILQCSEKYTKGFLMTKSLMLLNLVVLLYSCSVDRGQTSKDFDKRVYLSKEGTRLALVRYNPCFCGLKENDSVIDFEVGMISEQDILKQISSIESAASFITQTDSSFFKTMSLEEHLGMSKIFLPPPSSNDQTLRWERVVAVNAVFTPRRKKLLKAIITWWANNPTQYLLLKVKFRGVKMTAQGHHFRTLEFSEIAGLGDLGVNILQQSD